MVRDRPTYRKHLKCFKSPPSYMWQMNYKHKTDSTVKNKRLVTFLSVVKLLGASYSPTL